jgi:hypothetical protein
MLKTQQKQQKLLVSIYWDLQNVFLNQEQVNLLVNFIKAKGHIFEKKVYYNSLCENQAAENKKLQNLGFICIDVPCVLKDSADNQIKSDLIDDINKHQSPDIVILVSGDGDFANSVSVLRKLGKKVVVMARKGNLKKQLKELADETLFVDDLFEFPVNTNQTEINSVDICVNYNEALDFLIEAIKTASNQRKCTKFSYVDNLMRQLYKNYQGISSIRTPDGKKFKSFSCFIDAAVKDGKVRRQNQELFLIELDKLAA